LRIRKKKREGADHEGGGALERIRQNASNLKAKAIIWP